MKVSWRFPSLFTTPDALATSSTSISFDTEKRDDDPAHTVDQHILAAG